LFRLPVLCAPRPASFDLDITSWGVASGLPEETITSIQQTPEGFLWLGTMQGLYRFDGWKFTGVSMFSGPRSPAGVVKITAQCVDSSSALWIATESHGVFRLDPGLPPPLRAKGVGLQTEKINAIGADHRGAVWIGTENGLVKWEQDRFSKPLMEAGVEPVGVLALQVTISNGVWLTTRAGLQKYENGKVRQARFDQEAPGAGFRGAFENREGSLWYFGDTYLLNVSDKRRFNYFRGGGASALQVWSICEGKDGQLWIGTSGQGLFNFSGNRFHPVDLRQDRDHSDVRAVFMDKDGQLWVGTRTGLLRLRERPARWFGSSSGAATCLAMDAEGRVWAGFEHGGLFFAENDLLEPVPEANPLAAQNLITSIYTRPADSSFWMGTDGQGLLRTRQGQVQRFTTADGLSDDAVLAICGAPGGRVWVSTRDGKVHRLIEQVTTTFDTSLGLTGDSITAMTSAAEGGLWVGTSRGDVLRFNGERFELLPRSPRMMDRAITAFLEASDKRLWAGTDGGGLACLIEGNRWRIWSPGMGLPDGRITGVEEAADGTIWVATRAGVVRVPDFWREALGSFQWWATTRGQERRQLHVLVEFPDSGEKPVGAGFPRSLRTRDGKLWFATESGVVSFDPANVGRSGSAPEARIESVRINGSPEHWRNASGPIELPAQLREVLIKFTAPSIATPEKTRFRHRLDGFDPDWIDSTETRAAQYGKLSGGDYRFRVQCSDADGNWSQQEAQIELTVPVPLWKKPAGLALQGIALAGIVAGLVRVASHTRLKRQLALLEQQRAMERERARIAQDMHDELGAKLTKISFMSERAALENSAGQSGKDAPERMNSIAATSRDLLHSLDEIVWAVNPRNDRLESLAEYLGQHASEYMQDTPVKMDLRMPGPLPDVPLSAEIRHNLFLAFQEALGNALKHSRAFRVRVSMILDGNMFKITVRDDGRGFLEVPADEPAQTSGKPPGRTGSGLRGMRERLKKIGGTCEITSFPGEGTTVVLSIPVAVPAQDAPEGGEVQ
jgi:signal transduction histidine kinase/ligand-binding sensor domain-containing protein